jgi:hypothetical protein
MFGVTMIRVLAYIGCLMALAWLMVGHLHFRESLRTSLQDAQSLMGRVDPDHAADAGKVLNSYYESIYRRLPVVLWPAGILMVSSTILLMTGTPKKAEPSTGSNAASPRASV